MFDCVLTDGINVRVEELVLYMFELLEIRYEAVVRWISC